MGMKKLIILLSLGCIIISCTSKQKILYADKNNPSIDASKKYDTAYVEEQNGNLRMIIREIK
jgi:hypothetical protein